MEKNKSLQKKCDKQNFGIIFEFTAPGTPQQNSVAERRIPTLMGRARAMLIQAGLEPKYKEEFWCEVISTATKHYGETRKNPPPPKHTHTHTHTRTKHAPKTSVASNTSMGGFLTNVDGF